MDLYLVDSEYLLEKLSWFHEYCYLVTVKMKPENANSLETKLAAQLKRRRLDGRLRRLNTRSKNMRDFSSNSYLSLDSNTKIVQSYLTSVASSDGLGSGGSRLLDGNSSMAEALEQYIASFHHAPSGLMFNSGFEANVGLFSCVPDVNDVIVYDELIHASVHDGMRLSRVKKKVAFAHNVVGNDCNGEAAQEAAIQSLHRVLSSITDIAMAGESAQRLQRGEANVFVAVEGLYSMDGDVAPLKQILDCVEQILPLGNGHVIVDEAHSTGLFGDNGRGLVCDLCLEQRVWARLHTFGKAMGCSGGKSRTQSWSEKFDIICKRLTPGGLV